MKYHVFEETTKYYTCTWQTETQRAISEAKSR